MSAAIPIINAIGAALQLASSLATSIGDVVTAKKVDAILKEGHFPGFYDKAKEAGDKAKEALDDRRQPSDE